MESTLVLAKDTLLELARHPAFADDAPEFNRGGGGYDAIRAIEKALRQADKEDAAAPELAEALRDMLAHYAPEALECDDWVLSGNTQTDAILRAARAALLKAGVKL